MPLRRLSLVLRRAICRQLIRRLLCYADGRYDAITAMSLSMMICHADVARRLYAATAPLMPPDVLYFDFSLMPRCLLLLAYYYASFITPLIDDFQPFSPAAMSRGAFFSR